MTKMLDALAKLRPRSCATREEKSCVRMRETIVGIFLTAVNFSEIEQESRLVQVFASATRTLHPRHDQTAILRVLNEVTAQVRIKGRGFTARQLVSILECCVRLCLVDPSVDGAIATGDTDEKSSTNSNKASTSANAGSSSKNGFQQPSGRSQVLVDTESPSGKKVAECVVELVERVLPFLSTRLKGLNDNGDCSKSSNKDLGVFNSSGAASGKALSKKMFSNRSATTMSHDHEQGIDVEDVRAVLSHLAALSPLLDVERSALPSVRMHNGRPLRSPHNNVARGSNCSSDMVEYDALRKLLRYQPTSFTDAATASGLSASDCSSRACVNKFVALILEPQSLTKDAMSRSAIPVLCDVLEHLCLLGFAGSPIVQAWAVDITSGQFASQDMDAFDAKLSLRLFASVVETGVDRTLAGQQLSKKTTSGHSQKPHEAARNLQWIRTLGERAASDAKSFYRDLPVSVLARFVWACGRASVDCGAFLHKLTERFVKEKESLPLRDMCYIVEGLTRMDPEDPTIMNFLELLSGDFEARQSEGLSTHDTAELVLELALYGVRSRALSWVAAQLLLDATEDTKFFDGISVSPVQFLSLSASTLALHPIDGPCEQLVERVLDNVAGRMKEVSSTFAKNKTTGAAGAAACSGLSCRRDDLSLLLDACKRLNPTQTMLDKVEAKGVKRAMEDDELWRRVITEDSGPRILAAPRLSVSGVGENKMPPPPNLAHLGGGAKEVLQRPGPRDRRGNQVGKRERSVRRPHDRADKSTSQLTQRRPSPPVSLHKTGSRDGHSGADKTNRSVAAAGGGHGSGWDSKRSWNQWEDWKKSKGKGDSSSSGQKGSEEQSSSSASASKGSNRGDWGASKGSASSSSASSSWGKDSSSWHRASKDDSWSGKGGKDDGWSSKDSSWGGKGDSSWQAATGKGSFDKSGSTTKAGGKTESRGAGKGGKDGVSKSEGKGDRDESSSWSACGKGGKDESWSSGKGGKSDSWKEKGSKDEWRSAKGEAESRRWGETETSKGKGGKEDRSWAKGDDARSTKGGKGKEGKDDWGKGGGKDDWGKGGKDDALRSKGSVKDESSSAAQRSGKGGKDDASWGKGGKEGDGKGRKDDGKGRGKDDARSKGGKDHEWTTTSGKGGKDHAKAKGGKDEQWNSKSGSKSSWGKEGKDDGWGKGSSGKDSSSSWSKGKGGNDEWGSLSKGASSSSSPASSAAGKPGASKMPSSSLFEGERMMPAPPPPLAPNGLSVVGEETLNKGPSTIFAERSQDGDNDSAKTASSSTDEPDAKRRRKDATLQEPATLIFEKNLATIEAVREMEVETRGFAESDHGLSSAGTTSHKEGSIGKGKQELDAAELQDAEMTHTRFRENKQYKVNRRVEEPTEWDPAGFLFDLDAGDVVTVSVVPSADDEDNRGWVVAEYKEYRGETRVGWIEEDVLDDVEE
ncbi:unnamed protein product [Amoebophrya sp. A25]|nr:unnamed protein product [Amoebophrya sp. A25]|eukprot:GSA25T00005721001.1